MDSLEENGSSCYQNRTIVMEYASFALSGLCAMSLMISIPAVVLGIHEYCVKGNFSDLRTERLLLYLAGGTCIFSFLGCFQWISYFSVHLPVAKTGCSILAFLWFMVANFSVVITFCIGVHFLMQIRKPKFLNVSRDKLLKISKRMEMAYLSFAILSMVVLSPWPFVQNLFGYNMWICWIITANDYCGTILLGSTIATMFYVATLLVLLFSFFVIVAIQIIICSKKRNIASLSVWLFFVYIITFMAVFLVTVIIHFLKVVPSDLRGLQIFSLGIMSLIISVLLLISVSCKKWFDKYRPQNQAFDFNGYHQVDKTSDAPTTTWNPPLTDEIKII